MLGHEFLWVEKYRPRTVADTILPAGLKQTFERFVADGSIPNLLLAGRAGIGKTTIARAMCEELGADYIIINGSMNGNIDTLRTEIKNFASSVSFSGGRKYVILDEADYLNANSTQPALRNFMEEYSSNCGFILTANFKNRIIDPLHSRCSVVEVKIEGAEKAKLAREFHKRVAMILDTEGVPYDNKAVAEVIMKYFPDWRRVLNELQRYAATGQIDAGILTNMQEESFKTLIGHMKGKEYSKVRKWAAENSDIDSVTLFRKFYDAAHELMDPKSIPQLVLTLGDYQYKAAFVADQEINTVAALTEIMVECSWKA
jgi:DNA polymerase III delta prime subunit